MPIAHLLELWKGIEVEPMETEVSGCRPPPAAWRSGVRWGIPAASARYRRIGSGTCCPAPGVVWSWGGGGGGGGGGSSGGNRSAGAGAAGTPQSRGWAGLRCVERAGDNGAAVMSGLLRGGDTTLMVGLVEFRLPAV
uniref:Uncharacterized protein n=1 Tax=Accipiter nisus TaxID=211598 RepID=A0A8B9RWK7_9AVES